MEPVSPKASPALFDSPGPNQTSLPPDDDSHNNNVISTQPQYPQAPPNLDGLSITPSRSPTNNDFDNLIHGALSSLTPAQIQQLMNSISMPSMTDFPGSGTEQHNDLESSLMSYQPPFDFGQLSSFPLIPSPPPSANLVEKVDKPWRDTDEIEQDVDAVDSKINNLFQQFQIPTDGSSELLGSDNPVSVSDSSNTGNIDSELFHSFLNGLGDDDDVMLGDQDNASTAFLDEVPSASDGTLSPVNIIQEERPTTQPKSAKKRKSDMPDTPNLDKGLSPGTRPKRRRER